MRLPAEWERQKALLVAYPHEKSDWAPYLAEIRSFYDEFIAVAARYQEVIVLSEENLSFPTAPHPIRNAVIPTNDTWVRDYGPITLIEDGKAKLLDFTFNGWGLKYPANLDNQVNRRLFGTRKLGFVLEGGSIESNGEGTILTTSRCLLEVNRNPHLTKSEIETYLKSTLGARNVLWLDYGYMEGDDTDGHIDMLARFTSPDTIAYVQCDKEDSHYEEFVQMERQLQSFGFHLVPLPWVSAKYYANERLPASYTNFVIINDAVIVPTYNDPNDQEALKIMQKLFPGRDVIGLDASVLIRQHGSIHCSCINLFEG